LKSRLESPDVIVRAFPQILLQFSFNFRAKKFIPEIRERIVKGMKNYVGYIKGKGLERFLSSTTPTQESHGEKYVYVIGPFTTTRAAKWAEKYGWNNPHFQHVSDAERLSRN